MTPADVRDRLIHALRADLVGPALPDEILDEAPTRFYLTGFLAPLNASLDQRSDPTANDEPDQLEPASAVAEDNSEPPRTSARHSPFPVSLGLSVLVSADTTTLNVQLDWGDYHRLDLPPDDPTLPPEETAESDPTIPISEPESDSNAPILEQWQRL